MIQSIQNIRDKQQKGGLIKQNTTTDTEAHREIVPTRGGLASSSIRLSV